MGKNAKLAAALAAVLFSVFGLTACGEPGPGKGADDTAATVNGVAIPVSKIDQIIDRQLKESGPSAPQLTPVALTAARLKVLETLIQEEAMYQRAQKERLIPTDDEVKQALQTQIQQSGMSQDDFQKRLKDFGQTEDELKADLKRQLAIQKLQDKITALIPAPTDAEMRKYFEENKSQLIAPRGVELSDIIVDPANNGAADDAIGVEAARKKADEIVAALGSNADFATVARARSEDVTGLQGGSIGFFSEDRLRQTFPAEIGVKIFAMTVGQMTQPIQSQDGRLHIFKLNGKREQSKDLTFEEVSAEIAKLITDQRKQVVLSALLIEAVATANIRNSLAEQIVAHPDTFGALRPSPLTNPKPDAGTPAQPATNAAPAAVTNTAGEAQPSGPANTNARNAASGK
ncbi:MAG: SurA N-terminal domain-containing protein [Acidobacteria bacterium]|nr:SurA N-terminal domain-containing protein [Acidobacteriota bacterium]